ncbi:MAG TPA: response regulator [Anaeromyxobacteraceae bacterium]|nr:response regulator [Anaeromyxobacteraceae bacterium]
MVVEDDPELSDALAEYLSRRGISVLSADTGKAALELLDAGQTPDLILLDAHVKDMDADRFLEAFRHPRVPVAIMSGDPRAVRWANAHRLSFIPKPFPLDDLDRIIQENRRPRDVRKTGSGFARRQ